MSKLETESRKRAKRVRLENIILGTLAVAGVVAVGLAAPNVLQLLKKVDPEWLLKRDPRRRLREVASRLKKKGYVEFIETGRGSKTMRLTQKGKSAADRIASGNMKIPTPRRWDNKWRIVIFDIREKRKGLRDKIRSMVQGMGFFRLQDSVWVYPYDCEEIMTLLKANLKIGSELLYIIADAIEFDRSLRAHFNLPIN